MSRYITEFTIPSNNECKDTLQSPLIQGHHHEYHSPLFYDDEMYPLGIFPNGLHLEFAPVTILYGHNGRGKTILNLMASKLEIGRRPHFYISPFFPLFAICCQISSNSDFDEIGRRRDIITSDDVFNHCFAVRDANKANFEQQNEKKQEKSSKMNGQVASLRGMEDFDRCERDISFQRKSFWKFLGEYSIHYLKPASIGETALEFFTSTINSAGVYLLDEPGHSLSPSFQLKLIEFLELTSEFLGMQYIIATHSPLLLGMSKAKILNLDEEGAPECSWAELENIRILHDFFARREADFK